MTEVEYTEGMARFREMLREKEDLVSEMDGTFDTRAWNRLRRRLETLNTERLALGVKLYDHIHGSPTVQEVLSGHPA